ncbi:hypothetical protein B7463_g6066, partial [Scytalidium lignicola]
MARKFLDQERNSQTFWSEGAVVFPDDKEKIIELLAQLFWRQISKSFSNMKQLEKAKSMKPPHQNNLPSPSICNSITLAIPGPLGAPQDTPALRELTTINTIAQASTAKKSVFEVSSDDSNDCVSVDSRSSNWEPRWARTQQQINTQKRLRNKTHKRRATYEEQSLRVPQRRRTGGSSPQLAVYEGLDRYTRDIEMEADHTSKDAEYSTASSRKKETGMATEIEQSPRRHNEFSTGQSVAPVAPMITHEQCSSVLPRDSGSSAEGLENAPSLVVKLKGVRFNFTQSDQPTPMELNGTSSRESTSISQSTPLPKNITTSTEPLRHNSADSESVEGTTTTTHQAHSRCRSEDVSQNPLPVSKYAVLDDQNRAKISWVSESFLAPKQTKENHTASSMLLPPQPQPAQDISSTSTSSGPDQKASTQHPVPSVIFWIITHDPILEEERWDDGIFLNTTLSEFTHAIAKATGRRDRIEKLKLTLSTPSSRHKFTVRSDDEVSWVSGKQTFAAPLQAMWRDITLGRVNEPPEIKITIEPFYERVSTSNDAVVNNNMILSDIGRLFGLK